MYGVPFSILYTMCFIALNDEKNEIVVNVMLCGVSILFWIIMSSIRSIGLYKVTLFITSFHA